MQRRQIGMHIINSWPEAGLKVVSRAQVPANQWVHVAVTYDGSQKAAGIQIYYNGKPQQTNIENDKLKGTIQTPVPFKIGQRSDGDQFTGSLQDLRIYKRTLTPAEVDALARHNQYESILAKPNKNEPPKRSNNSMAIGWKPLMRTMGNRAGNWRTMIASKTTFKPGAPWPM